MTGPIATRERRTLVDLLRLVASVTIVHHHMNGDHLFRIGLGVPLFLLLLFGLGASSSLEEPLGAFARRRSRFLLAPWLRWSAIYVAILVASDVAQGRGTLARLEPEMLAKGGVPSLWFLPFAALALLALRGVQHACARIPAVATALGAALLAAVWTRTVTDLTEEDLSGWPFRVWLCATPALFWGLALGVSLRERQDARRHALLAAVGALAVLALLLPSAGASDRLVLRYAIAVPLACVGFAWSPRVPAFVPALASLCFGIYLAHPLAGKLLDLSFDVRAWPALLHTLAAWSLSAALIVALRRAGLSWSECAAPARDLPVRRLAPPRELAPPRSKAA